MQVKFAKLNGLGNDFVMIDNMDKSLALSPEEVIALCDRRFGIGADGVILVEPPRSDDALAHMNYINSDGTLAQMCGNGIRCTAKFLIDNQIVDATEPLGISTLSGTKLIEYTEDGGKMRIAKVNMGNPILDPEIIPAKVSANSESEGGLRFAGNVPLSSPWGDFEFTFVSMGNPHAICFIDDFDGLSDQLFSDSERSLATLDVDKVGRHFESHPAFPEKSNIEFAHVTDDQNIEMRVYERGCGETLACGTGACATAVASILQGSASSPVTIHLLGGDLEIAWNGTDDVFMTGPAEESFEGYVEIPC